MQEYDHLINWENFYKPRLQNAKINGTEIKGLCPLHSETDGSFTASLQTGKWKCFGCDRSGNALTYLQEAEGLSKQDALKVLGDEAGIDLLAEQKEKRSYTLADYAHSKKLDPEFLGSLGVKNVKNGVQIPYYDLEGNVASNRKRFGDTGSGPKFLWTRGSKTLLYGLWQLQKISKEGWVVLVEGESDSQTLWQHGIPALGIPGANTFKPEWADHVKDLKHIYIFNEQDTAGETMKRKVCEGLLKAGYKGKAYSLTLIDAKDPSELHCSDPENFLDRWQAALDNTAEELDIIETAERPEQVQITDAPVQLKQPPGYQFSDQGLVKVDPKTGMATRFCRTPMLISRRIKSVEDNTEKVEICYKQDGSWKYEIYPRSLVFASRSITQLADQGMTISSENSRHVIAYLQALEDENYDLIESTKAVSQLGWLDRKHFLPCEPGDYRIDVDPATRNTLDAYHEEGSLEEWRQLMSRHRNQNDIFRFLLASSFAAPLLHWLRHRIFMVHNWGSTRIGKTAALKAALSVWGEPTDLMTTFFTTAVGLERIAGLYKDLPLGIDEKQVSNKKDDIAEMLVYMISGGKGKGRGAKDGGLQAAQQWRSVVITTGEEPLVGDNAMSGSYSRIVEIEGAPFETEKQAEPMHSLNSYGHAGPMFVKDLIALGPDQVNDDFKALRAETEAVLSQQYDILPSNMTAISVVMLADIYAAQWIFGEEYQQAKGRALDMAMSIAQDLIKLEDVDLGRRAEKYMQGWIATNMKRFTDPEMVPRYGYYSDEEPDTDEGVFLIINTVLDQALDEGGFSKRSVLQAWRKSEHCDILVPRDNADEAERITVQRRWEGMPTRFYRLRFKGEVDFGYNNTAGVPEVVKQDDPAVANSENEQVRYWYENDDG